MFRTGNSIETGSGFQGVGERGKRSMTGNGYGVSFGGDKNVELDNDDRCPVLCLY